MVDLSKEKISDLAFKAVRDCSGKSLVAIKLVKLVKVVKMGTWKYLGLERMDGD